MNAVHQLSHSFLNHLSFSSPADQWCTVSGIEQDVNTVEPRYNEPLYNKLKSSVTNDILRPGNSTI